MKQKHSRSRKRAVLTCIIVVLLIAFGAIGINAIDHAKYTSAKYYAGFVAENESKLIELADKTLLAADLAKTPEEILNDPLMDRSKFCYVQSVNECVVFIIDYQYAPSGGRIGVIYVPDGVYEPTVRTPENWHPVETGDENTLRWEGGMGGRGWIDVTRISDNFFFEKASIPT